MNRPIKWRIRCNSGDKPFHYFEVPTAHLEMALELYDLDTTGLFTGLTDKNGKEIYEGDVLQTETGTCEVKWYGDGACFRFKYGHNWESPLNYDEQEVIGNIYENPELLKT